MFARLLSILIVLLAVGLGHVSLAKDAKPPTTTSVLNDVAKELKAIDLALDTPGDSEAQRDLRTRVLAAQATLDERLSALEEQLEFVDAKLTGLGAAPPDAPEASEIVGQRKQLTADRTGIDAALKRARLLDVEARQLIDEIDRNQIAEISQKLMAKATSPLAPSFWQAIADELPRDTRRLEEYATLGWTQIQSQWDGSFPWPVVLGVGGAVLLIFPARFAARRLGRRFLVDGAPGHRVRRSAYAVWRVVVGTIAPLLAMVALGQGLRWSGLLPERWSGMFDVLTIAIGFSGFVASLGYALLMPKAASWRLLKVSDRAAERLVMIPWLLSIFAIVSITLTAFNRDLGASQPIVVATDAMIALVYLTLIGLCLLIIARLRTETAEGSDTSTASSSAWLGGATLLAWLSILVALIALLTGYIAFSLFIAQFITWAAILAGVTYLAMITVDDLATSLFTRQSPVGRTFTRALGITGSAIDQFGVILSGGLRVALVFIALSLLVTPFAGGGMGALFERAGGLGSGIQFGGLTISFGAILRGVIVLVIGLTVVRLFMRWLENTYLPVTGWDESGRNSFGLIIRYLGIALAGIWSIAALGIGVENIALLLSALSVGIGFGLQAITQNFVSGLILLAERPIKIGDLVRIGTDEGDVKRISVRSTEIVLSDHSTLIVPNSELITKTVLNKTLASPLGRVQVQFSVPIETDADQIRTMVLEAFASETSILAEPKPSVFIDNIKDGRIMFNGFAHVANPRSAYGARSHVLVTLLRRFRDEGIEIGTVTQKLELIQPAPAEPFPINPAPAA